MKTKRRKPLKIIGGLALLCLVGLAAMMIFRPDYRFEAKQALCSVTSGNLKLSPADKNSLNLKTVSVEGLDSAGYTIDQSMILVNRRHTLGERFTPELKDYSGGAMKINVCADKAFAKLSNTVLQKFGEDLLVVSSYRTAEEQAQVESEEGSSTAMPAGSSEHQTGLAVDFCLNGYAGKSVLKTQAGRYINESCGEYGFIIRYPAGKSSVTGIDYEPWHLRYVGLPHSKIISDAHITLEEYFDMLEYGEFYSYENYMISHQKGDSLKIPEGEKVTISEDNCGGYLICVKK